MEAAVFPLGTIIITTAALNALDGDEVQKALNRHHNGDWGKTCEQDRRENEIALAEGRRLFSVYRDRSTIKFYVITEADRSVTTVLLPEDY
jgi:hypothetical protein